MQLGSWLATLELKLEFEERPYSKDVRGVNSLIRRKVRISWFGR